MWASDELTLAQHLEGAWPCLCPQPAEGPVIDPPAVLLGSDLRVCTWSGSSLPTPPSGGSPRAAAVAALASLTSQLLQAAGLRTLALPAPLPSRLPSPSQRGLLPLRAPNCSTRLQLGPQQTLAPTSHFSTACLPSDLPSPLLPEPFHCLFHFS